MCITKTVLAALFPGLLAAGTLTDRFELTLERVLHGGAPVYDEALLLADVIPEHVRLFTNFSGDLSGRYVGALASVGEHREEEFPGLDPLVFKILSHQRNDGHFGDPMGRLSIHRDDMARYWGNGRLLIGLLEYYRMNPAPQVLQAAERLGDFLVSRSMIMNAQPVRRYFSGEQFATGYVCWTQNIEGLVELYRLTSKESYLGLAREMAARARRHPRQHSHGLLSSWRGILALAEVTGETSHLEQVDREWESLVRSENLLIQGAIPEAFAPAIERDEGCSEADWLRLNLGLWRATRRPRYLEQAERTLFNAFFLNQFASGDFGHLRLLPGGLDRETTPAWWCCTLHGLRAFPAVFDSVFRAEDSTLYYDLPVDGQGRLNGWRVEAISSLETEGVIRFQVMEADGEPRTLAIRQPSWAKSVHVLVGGESASRSAAGGYTLVERVWQPGDSVEVKYDFALRIRRDARREGAVAVFYGPWLLALSEETSPEFFQEHLTEARILIDSLRRKETAGPDSVAPTAPSQQPFKIPVGHWEAAWVLPQQKAEPRTALLQPVAERTGLASPARWQFWLPEGPLNASADAPAPADSAAERRWIASALLLAAAGLLWALLARRRRRAQ